MSKEHRQRNKDFLRKHKTDNPCTDCGVFYHYCQMQFDHLSDKSFAIGYMASGSYSIARLQEEMDKCELVSANCHALRSWNRIQ